ncbi:hypothetical protein ACEU2D_24450 [Brevibacillus laterosporus]|uniref:hypothetical protein n=1 Tax=Brevibacillus laterosporus TaxID=1465 RepID=UPI0035A669BA
MMIGLNHVAFKNQNEQQIKHLSRTFPSHFVAFDLLYLNGYMLVSLSAFILMAGEKFNFVSIVRQYATDTVYF